MVFIFRLYLIQICVPLFCEYYVNLDLFKNLFQMIRALLRAQGVLVTRSRVREMLTRVNPTAAARRWSRTVARRVYHVPYPNSLWHIDGNMRLIRLLPDVILFYILKRTSASEKLEFTAILFPDYCQ